MTGPRDNQQPNVPVPAELHWPAAPGGTSLRRLVARRPAAAQRDPSEEFSAGIVLHALRQWWKLAVPLGLLLGGAGAAVVFALFEPQYEATAWIRIREMRPALVFPLEERESRQFVATQQEMLRSPEVLLPVLSRPEIARLPEIAALERKGQDKVAGLSGLLRLDQIGQSEFLRVAFRGPSAEHAAQIVNAAVEEYFKLLGQEDARQVSRVVELLERERDHRKAQVEAKQEEIRQMVIAKTGKDPFLAPRPEQSPRAHPLGELQGKLIAAEVEREVLEAQLQALEEMLQEQPIRVGEATVEQALSQDAEVQAAELQLAASRAKLDELRRISRDAQRDPYCQQLAAQVARQENDLKELKTKVAERIRGELESRLGKEREDELARMRFELEGRRMMETALRKRYEEELAKLEAGNVETVNLDFEQAELAQAQQVLDQITARILQLRTELQAPARVTLFSAARPPEAPVVSVPWKQMGLAGGFGLFLPLLLAVGWERIVRRITDSDVLEMESNLPVVGEIARLPERLSRSRRSVSRRLAWQLRLYEESIDSMRTALVLAEELREMRVLAVTSAAKQEGKTSVAAQLAVSLARASGEPTLLIDGDLRSPDLHRIFEVPQSPGLAEVLSGRCSLEEAVATGWSQHVHILPAGRLRASPHKLFGNGAVQAVMQEARQRYRFIIVDTPPVLAAGEALVLGKTADALLFCAMRDYSQAGQVRKACQRLQAASCRLVAAVLNGMPARRYQRDYGRYDYVVEPPTQ